MLAICDEYRRDFRTNCLQTQHRFEETFASFIFRELIQSCKNIKPWHVLATTGMRLTKKLFWRKRNNGKQNMNANCESITFFIIHHVLFFLFSIFSWIFQGNPTSFPVSSPPDYSMQSLKPWVPSWWRFPNPVQKLARKKAQFQFNVFLPYSFKLRWATTVSSSF